MFSVAFFTAVSTSFLILSIAMLKVLILSVVLLGDDMLSVVASYNMLHLG